MSIASTLNIAKEALLTHQSSISVAGHNIANVNTPGYSRQVLGLTTPIATPTGVGYLGNGVRGDTVTRQYDQFMLQRQMNQNSNINNLTTQQQSLSMIETSFNEVPGLAVNELLSKFWESWQALSNNPELSSNRQTVVQQAELLNTQLQNMSAELTQTKFDTGVTLKSAIDDVNALTKEIADINAKLTASETAKQPQNDLRDTRDTLMNKLAGYVDVRYFESSNGSYTVMMSDGHSLVNNNEAWSLDWTNDTLQWINVNSTGQQVYTTLPADNSLGGTIGGLMEINNQLTEGNPDNYLGRLNALTNALIREVNQQHSQGVGLVSFSGELSSAELANNATLLHTTVDSRSATDTLASGSLTINGRSIGRIDGAKTTYGLAMGKTANAAQAINDAAAGVLARMTTLVAGTTVQDMTADDTKTIDFTVNGVQVSYTVDSTSPGSNDSDPAVLAGHLVTAINDAITNYNKPSTLTPPQENLPKITIEAVVGNGANGGALNAIVLRNSHQGDESKITINGIDTTGSAMYEAKIGLVNGSNQADKTHNTGQLSLFSNAGQISIEGGANDTNLAHLGWAGITVYSSQAATAETLTGTPSSASFTLNGKSITVTIPDNTPATTVANLAVAEINKWISTTGVTAERGDNTNGGVTDSIVFSSQTSNIVVSDYQVISGSDVLGFGNFEKTGVAAADETPGDGKLLYTAADHQVSNSLMGLDYADTLQTDGNSFDLWLYNKNGSLALAQPVTIDLTRAYTLDDVASTINAAITNASKQSTPWVAASVVGNRLVLKPDADHDFAFGNDTSNFLAAVGINTFFSGHSVSTIAINQAISGNLDNVAAGKINQFGEIFTGDNANALLLTNLQREEDITYTGRGSRTDTLDGFYNSLIAEIGLKGKSIDSDLEYNQLLMDQLNEMRDSSSGVSLDEEMANLIKFQHAYSAAAKLISTSDEMLKTLLDSVR